MTLTDQFDPALTDPTIVTRSDYAPTDYDRYGEWARKFFGFGCHQEYKDSNSRTASLAAEPHTRH